jgi:penicillin V acylase-like amidase (Ntn superfamily)
MCTSLVYTGSDGAIYLGRTLELDVEEPWAVAYVPAGTAFESVVHGEESLPYTAKHRFVGVAPAGRHEGDDPIESSALASMTEGLNDAGLTCSMLAYPATAGGESGRKRRAALQAIDLGTWILSQFATVADVKEGLEAQPVFLTPMSAVGDVEFPFHIVVHDRAGGAIVIEWHHGEQAVYGNPVGVMTNGPPFSWHLTNLGNWTHLTNVDSSSARFGSLDVAQPDSGIATAALPGSNTSVGRFIRAIYYSQFAEKTADADAALVMLARVMNNFDRPRDITIDPPGAGGEGVTFEGTGRKEGAPGTEYTSWTNLSDLNRGRFLLRTYTAFNYTAFDLDRLADVDGIRLMATTDLDPMGGDDTEALGSAKAS